jgi:hypothetical protein
MHDGRLDSWQMAAAEAQVAPECGCLICFPRPASETTTRAQHQTSACSRSNHRRERGFAGEKQPTTLRRLPSKSHPNLPTPPCSPGARGRLSRRSRSGASGVSRGVNQPVENRRRILALFRPLSCSRGAGLGGWLAVAGAIPPPRFAGLSWSLNRAHLSLWRFHGWLTGCWPPALFSLRRLLLQRDRMRRGRSGISSRRCSAKASFTRYCTLGNSRYCETTLGGRRQQRETWSEGDKDKLLPQQRKATPLEGGRCAPAM